MKIVKHLRHDAARLVGIGVAVGLSATATAVVARTATSAQPDAKATATSSASPQSSAQPQIFSLATPTPTLSPQLSAQIDDQITFKPEPVAAVEATPLPVIQATPAPAAMAAAATPAPWDPAVQVTPTPTVQLTPAPAAELTLASLTHDLPSQVAAATPVPWDPAVQVTPTPTIELTSEPAAQLTLAGLSHDLPDELSDAAPALPHGGAIAFAFPLPGYSVNSRFGLRQLSFEPRARMHDGVDIAAPKGSAIHAAAAGYVVRTGLSSSYGHFVELAHADGLTSFYAHMSRTAGLERGSKVSAGEVLGYVGSTGHSTGPHLHFEIRDDGKPLNPQDFLNHVFASAADLSLVEAQATAAISARATDVVSHFRQRMLASWHWRAHGREHGRGRWTERSYAIYHRVHARFAAAG